MNIKITALSVADLDNWTLRALGSKVSQKQMRKMAADPSLKRISAALLEAADIETRVQKACKKQDEALFNSLREQSATVLKTANLEMQTA
jgi:hypothetical protein